MMNVFDFFLWVESGLFISHTICGRSLVSSFHTLSRMWAESWSLHFTHYLVCGWSLSLPRSASVLFLSHPPDWLVPFLVAFTPCINQSGIPLEMTTRNPLQRNTRPEMAPEKGWRKKQMKKTHGIQGWYSSWYSFDKWYSDLANGIPEHILFWYHPN